MAAVPYAVAGKAITNLEILFNGSVLSQSVIRVAATAPGIFTLDETGAHEGAILNQDNSVNSGSHPADRGSIISIYGTGEGQTTPAGTDGLIATGTLPQPLIPVRVQIGGQEADSLGDRLMYRLAYRNFTSYESLVVNHSVQTNTAASGVRWYEIRDPNGSPVVFQQSTFAADTFSCWMGSMAMDKVGDIGLGFSVSSGAIHPAIAFM